MNCQPLWDILIQRKLGTKPSGKTKLDATYQWAKVRVVNRQQYVGLVHNLEVEIDHTYTTPAMAVHNCHEHVSYFTLGTFNEVVRRAGLQIIDVEHSTINGGSLRVYVGHGGSVWHVTPAVQQQYFNEYRTLDHHWPGRFERRMQQNIGQIRSMVECVTAQGGLVDLYGASTKGNTLLQVLDRADLIRCAWERNPRKVGRCTVTGVPIVDEERGRAVPPDALLATIWQFADQIIAREQETLKTVRMILPLPEATWIDLYREEKRA